MWHNVNKVEIDSRLQGHRRASRPLLFTATNKSTPFSVSAGYTFTQPQDQEVPRNAIHHGWSTRQELKLVQI